MDRRQPRSRSYSFGSFVIDVGRGMLLRDDREIPLRPQSFEVLLLLVRKRGQLVTREELMSTVWAGKKVTEASITQCLVEIRAALNDADRSIVRTMPRRGYLFEAPVEAGPAPGSAPTMRLPRRLPLLLAGLLAGLMALLWGVSRRMPPAEEPVLAVLSFESRSELASDRQFADGLLDQMLSALDAIDGLKVISRLSIVELERQPFTLGDVRAELGASHAMTGSIDRLEDIVRLHVQIVDTRDGLQLLAQSYEHPLTLQDLSGLQRDMASRVAEAIGLHQGTSGSGTPGEAGADRKLAAASSTAGNLAAYEEFLKGLYFLRRIQVGDATEETFDSAAERFESAIEADPGWAAPRAALGMVYHFEAGRNGDYAEEERLLQESLRHVTEALELDPAYAPAYVSLGYVKFRLELDFEGARQAYDRAYELGDRMTWAWASALLALHQAEFERALDLFEQARARDPLNKIIKTQLAITLTCAERYEEAIEHWQELRQIRPENGGIPLAIAYGLVQSGKREEGKALFQQYEESEGDFGFKALLYALLNHPARAERLITLGERAEDWDTWEYAEAALVLGKEDRALSFLEKGAEARPRNLRNIRCSPHFRNLAGNPRYERVLRQIGLK